MDKGRDSLCPQRSYCVWHMCSVTRNTSLELKIQFPLWCYLRTPELMAINVLNSIFGAFIKDLFNNCRFVKVGCYWHPPYRHLSETNRLPFSEHVLLKASSNFSVSKMCEIIIMSNTISVLLSSQKYMCGALTLTLLWLVWRHSM